jgi:hypothetical protein
MKDKLLDIEGITKLFEEEQRRTLECIKEDWLLGISVGNKYMLECSDGNWIKFTNDHGNELGMKINNACKHFRTITSSRKTKLDNLFKKNNGKN